MKLKRYMALIPGLAFIFINLVMVQGCEKKENNESVPDRLTRIKSGNKYGYIGIINGKKFYIEPQYDFAWDFSEGLAVVEIAGKQGYIDMNGETVITPVFDKAYSFSEGFAKVKENGKYGYIDKSGKIVIGFQFDDASDFFKGMARVNIGKERFIIDKSGKTVTNMNKDQFQYYPLNFNEL